MINLVDVFKYLKNKYKLKNGFFCIYGSYATGTQHDKSDIDLLFIHRTEKSKLKRTSEKFNDISISFYEISLKDLKDDANGKYGGFFCGKMFNPHKLFDCTADDEQIISKSISVFFSNIFGEKHCKFKYDYTPDEILKNSIRIYFDLYPEFYAYIMRLMNSSNFKLIWNEWVKYYINILLDNNIIKKTENGYSYVNLVSVEKFEIIKRDYISRFWIYGAVSHNSNTDFYDFYKNKNKDYIISHEKLRIETSLFLATTYKTGGEKNDIL